MNYINFETTKGAYRLRLNTRNLVLLEQQLNENPLPALLGHLGKDEIPPVDMMIKILHASLLAYHPDMTMDKAYDVFDEWLDDGHIIADFLQIIIQIYRQAGLIEKEKTEKN